MPTCRETRTFSAPPEDPDDVITFDAPDGRADSIASDGNESDGGRVICWLFLCFGYYVKQGERCFFLWWRAVEFFAWFKLIEVLILLYSSILTATRQPLPFF